MSATGRTPGLRSKADDYATPPWCVARLLEAPLNYGLTSCRSAGEPARWLDPCAGEGRLIQAANEGIEAWSAAYTNIVWDACELRPECAVPLERVCSGKVVSGDFLQVVPARYDVVLTNPPYKLAEQFVRACLPIADQVIMLLRLNWLEGRKALWKAHPADIWILPDRPSFGLNKHGRVGTDATSYAWFDWHPGASGRVYHLAKTPLAVRAAYRRELQRRLNPLYLEAA